MSLTIKNKETHRLAQELAALTGETLTEAVAKAIQERLERVHQEQRREGLVERIMAIVQDTAPRFKEPYKSLDHADLLYDERGLPK